MSLKPAATTADTRLAIACLLLAFFAFCVVRGIALEPLVFADEWTHSVSTRLMRLTDVVSPSHLYYFLYRPTRSCGSDFLMCARLMNIAVLAGAGLMLFLFARRYVTTSFAFLLLIAFLAAPSNIYQLIFSPDALFYSGFVVFFVALLTLEGRARAMVSGALLGLLALVKINAIFLLPGLLLFFVLEYWLARRRPVDIVVNVVLAALLLVIVKMGVGYLLAGRGGLSLTGQHYASVASQGLDFANVLARLPLLAFSFTGYLATVLLILGAPLTAFVVAWPRLSQGERALGCAALCILLPPLPVFSLFAALVSDAGPYESIQRLSLRYFGFVFPFFYLLGLVALGRLDREALSTRMKVFSAAAAAVALVAAVVLANLFRPVSVESPELVFLTRNRFSMLAGSALLLLPLLLMLFRSAAVARAYAASLLLLALMWNILVLQELRPLRTPSPFDAAGRHAALFLGPERANVAVVAGDLSGIFRTTFHLNAVEPAGVLLTGAITLDDLLRQVHGKKWVLFVGPDALKFAPPGTPAPAGFALVRSEALVRKPDVPR